eukprot:scaffold327004_cov15-Prasinocladus_malaysianus.AAC.1
MARSFTAHIAIYLSFIRLFVAQAWEMDFKWTAAEAILRRVQMDGGLHPAGVPVDAEYAVTCALK